MNLRYPSDLEAALVQFREVLADLGGEAT